MTDNFATTPFGGGRISASSFLHREAVDRQRAALKEGADGRPNEHEMRYLRRMAELYDLDNADVRDALGRASETMPAE